MTTLEQAAAQTQKPRARASTRSAGCSVLPAATLPTLHSIGCRPPAAWDVQRMALSPSCRRSRTSALAWQQARSGSGALQGTQAGYTYYNRGLNLSPNPWQALSR